MRPQPPTLLLTRPVEASTRFLHRVEAAMGRAVPVVISPLVAIEPTGAPVELAPYRGVILTSQNAMPGLNPSPGMTAWCVGAETARAASAHGFVTRSADGDAGALIDLILSAGEQGPLIHLRGALTRGDIAATLTKAGVPTHEQIVYRQTHPDLSRKARALLDGTGPVIAPVFSPETMANLARQAPFAAPLHLVAISGAAAIAPPPHATLTIAARPDSDAMLAATLTALAISPGAG